MQLGSNTPGREPFHACYTQHSSTYSRLQLNTQFHQSSKELNCRTGSCWQFESANTPAAAFMMHHRLHAPGQAACSGRHCIVPVHMKRHVRCRAAERAAAEPAKVGLLPCSQPHPQLDLRWSTAGVQMQQITFSYMPQCLGACWQASCKHLRMLPQLCCCHCSRSPH